jgi:hypothetical protein
MLRTGGDVACLLQTGGGDGGGRPSGMACDGIVPVVE